ncbi:hypothetical protein IscW_ISCW001578 [Ixodes scapularis]|uniref:Uncharacterized protein n=1 Tax=Ixodes scapularis TaxID=6945 RepID=B7P296_IXOSC|nr:hypothetical protein IscW_ISCW001578 [Ixodes scapularis]|eukprot:XP_002401857.1 hypothetical protein IscW_ISCW001578 [Ixodes scapularis]
MACTNALFTKKIIVKRAVRSKALIDLHANDEHERYVDSGEYQRNAFAEVVNEATTGATKTAASVRSAGAEEVAIALAIADADCHRVLSDARQAVRNFPKSQICREAERASRAVKLRDRKVRFKWFPAHAGDASKRNDNHNETAHAAARDLTNRAPATYRPTWFEAKDRMTDYNDFTEAYRLARKILPPSHKRLSRAEAHNLKGER